MPPRTKEYSAASVTVTFKGVAITGFGPDTFVTAERNEDAFTLAVGADGESVRAKSSNKSGIVTLTLMQSSVGNDALSAAAKLDELSGDGVGSLFVKDLNGTTLVSSQAAYVRKVANAEFARESSTREWVIETGELDIFVGGSVAVV